MKDNNTNLLNTLVGTGAIREEIRIMLQQELRAALQAELTAALGYEKSDPLGWGTGNNRNGEYNRKIDTEFGQLDIAVPRDRNGEFKQHTLPLPLRIYPPKNQHISLRRSPLRTTI